MGEYATEGVTGGQKFFIAPIDCSRRALSNGTTLPNRHTWEVFYLEDEPPRVVHQYLRKLELVA